MSAEKRTDYGLKMSITLLAGALLWSESAAADNWNVAGEHGQLRVHGSLLEGPCLLDMRSEFQAVAMESSSLVDLQKPGDTGKPVNITFRLLGCKNACIKSAAAEETTLKFMSPADADEPSLFQLTGVTGVGLRLLDRKGRQILPGESVDPECESASRQLTYTVIPVRTKAPLTRGNFEATMDFGMSYE